MADITDAEKARLYLIDTEQLSAMQNVRSAAKLLADAARAWAQAKMQTDPVASRCQICRNAEAKIRLAEREVDGTVSMDICAECAPQYLRRLADIIESGDGENA